MVRKEGGWKNKTARIEENYDLVLGADTIPIIGNLNNFFHQCF